MAKPKKGNSAPKSGPKGRGKGKRYDIQDGQLSDDEIDAFDAGRDKVLLDNDRGKRKKESILDESDDDEEVLYDLPSDSDDSDEEREKAIQQEKNISTAWGKRKSMYYDADTAEADEDEDLKLEEEEALRIQKEKLAEATEADFDDSMMLEKVVELAEKRKSKKSKKEQKPLDEEESLLRAMDADLNDISIGLEGFGADAPLQLERIERDLSNLPKKEKLNLLMSESPELMPMIDDFLEKLDELQTLFIPLLDSKITKNLSAVGVKYVQMRAQLLLQYCLLCTFYFYLKSAGRLVKGHPCLTQIVQVRALFDKLEKLHQRLLPQLQGAADGSMVAGELEEEEEEEQEEQEQEEEEAAGEEGGSDVEGLSDLDDLPQEFDGEDDDDVEDGEEDEEDGVDDDEDEEEEEFVMTRKGKGKEVAGGKKGKEAQKATKSKGGKIALGAAELGSAEADQALDFYNSFKQQKQSKKQTPAAAKAAVREISPILDDDDDKLSGTSRRKATNQIVNNKGLVPYRKKENRNPRKKLRNKYEKAVKRRQVKKYSGKQENYGGEAAGIRTNLVRSVKLS